MSSRFEMPSHADLIVEQEIAQDGKHRTRMLGEYNALIFPGTTLSSPASCPVSDMLRPFMVDGQVSLEGLIAGMAKGKGQAVEWVEMGGGSALAMRELSLMPDMKSRVNTTNVDLFDAPISELPLEPQKYLDRAYPGITAEPCAPKFIQDNAETVQLPAPADLITSIETIQYLNNPLSGICNWYNQLSDNGLMIISAERAWPAWIVYEQEPVNYGDSPIADTLSVMAKAGVSFAVTDIQDYPGGIRPPVKPGQFKTLVVQKKAGTRLVNNSEVVKIWTNPSRFKSVYYDKPANQQIVDIMPGPMD